MSLTVISPKTEASEVNKIVKALQAKIRAKKGATGADGQNTKPVETAVSGESWHLINQRKALEALRGDNGPGAATSGAAGGDWLNIEETAVSQPTAVGECLHANNEIKIYPFLWCEANRRKHQAIFKIKTHLDHIRKVDRYLSTAEIKAALVETAVYTWDHINRQLKSGHGIYWDYDREAGKVWSYTAARVALALDLGADDIDHPVYVPKPKDISSLERFNVLAYEAWLTSVNASGVNPISRIVQSQKTGLSQRTLRKYTEISQRIKRESNYSRVGDRTKEKQEDVYYQHETAVFKFTDHQGKQGAAGAEYVARELPSTYQTGLNTAGKNRKKRIKKRFLVLANIRALRDGKQAFKRLYYESGKDAAQVASRGQEAYWRMISGISGNTLSPYQFWGAFNV